MKTNALDCGFLLEILVYTQTNTIKYFSPILRNILFYVYIIRTYYTDLNKNFYENGILIISLIHIGVRIYVSL